MAAGRRVALLSTATFVAVLACAGAIPGGPEGLVFGDDPRKPTEMSDELICHACHAVVTEVEKKLAPLGSRRSEADVFDAVSSPAACVVDPAT